MRNQLNSLTGVLALALSTAAAAQATPADQQPVKKAVPATPAQPATAQPATTVPDEPTTPQSTAPGQTQTTPGQSQTTPGEASQTTPAVTGQTPSGQTTSAEATPATAADLKKGLSVYDQSGALVGKIESVSAKGAVLSTGTTRAEIPLASFAKGEKGLVIGMTKADIDAAAKKSPTKPK